LVLGLALEFIDGSGKLPGCFVVWTAYLEQLDHLRGLDCGTTNTQLADIYR